MRFFVVLLLSLWSSLTWASSFQVISSGPLLADGQTESTVQLYLPGLSPNARVKVKARGGEVVSQHLDELGVLTVGLLPRYVQAQGTMTLSIRVRGALKLDEQVDVRVRPAAMGSLGIQVEPAQLRPGQTQATVSIRVPEGGHLAQDARQVAVSASVGDISGLRHNGNGNWSATYTAPAGLKNPVSALITAVDLTAPERVGAKINLPIRVTRSQTFSGPPGGRVLVMDGNKEYGPALVSPAGTAAFDMDLLPGSTPVEVFRSARGQARTQESQIIQSEADPQLAFVGLPDGMKVPVGRPIRLLLAHTGPGGEGIANAQNIRITGPGYPVLKPLGEGWYEVALNTPRSAGAFEVTARLGEYSVRMGLEAVLSASVLSASTDPAVLGQGQTLSMTVLARDEQGAALPGQQVGVYVHGGNARGRVRDGGDGSYTQSISVAGNTRSLTLIPYVTSSEGSLPAANVRLWSGLPSTAVANASMVPVFVVVEDAMGLPLRDQEFRITAPNGVELPTQGNTGDSGVAIVEFRSGSANPGPAVLQASSGALSSSAVVWILPTLTTQQKPVRLGSPWERAAVDRWRAGMPVSVVRETPAVRSVVVAPPPSSTPAVLPPVSSPVQDVPAAVPDAPRVPTASPSPFGVSPTAATGSAYVDQEETPFLQARAGLSTVGIEFSQTHDGAADSIPPEAEYSRGLPLGVVGLNAHLRARLMEDALHVEVDGRWGRYGLQTGEVTRKHSLTHVLAGARYRHPVEAGAVALRVEGGLWFHRTDMLSFKYNPDRTGANQIGQNLTGVRVGAGASSRLGPVDLSVLVAETFAPTPVDTHLGLSIDTPLGMVEVDGRPVFLRVDWATEFRHVGLTLEGIEVRLNDRLSVLALSAGFDL